MLTGLALAAATLLAGVGALLFVLLFVLWWRQERIVFQPSGPPYPTDTIERARYRAEDGQELFAFVITAARAAGR